LQPFIRNSHSVDLLHTIKSIKSMQDIRLE
jgi:hypothetical protein